MMLPNYPHALTSLTTVVAVTAGKVANENDDATALEVREIDVPRTN